MAQTDLSWSMCGGWKLRDAEEKRLQAAKGQMATLSPDQIQVREFRREALLSEGPK